MKKMSWLFTAGICFCAFGFAHPLQAGPTNDSAHKFGRGFANLVTSPLQLPKQIIQTTVEGEPHYLAPFKGMTAGVGLGVYHWIRQMISGFYDLFTFAKPGPPIYETESLLPEL